LGWIITHVLVLSDTGHGRVSAAFIPFLSPYQGHFTTGGMEDRIDLTFPPVLRPNVVPLS
jgi:hypothetical protein